MNSTLAQSIKALASFAATQHVSFRNDLLENCRQLAMEPGTLAEELRLLRGNPGLLHATRTFEARVAPNNGPKSWFIARNLTELLDPIENRSPERARDIARILKAEAVSRMDFEAIDAKHSAVRPAGPVA